MRSLCSVITVLVLPSLAAASVLVSQPPVSGGGSARWSQLWQDPSGNGNNLDGDSVCWEDFTLNAPRSINHIEWWGNGACELGFQIEFWTQDPNTIAHQPQSVFYYAYYGQGSPPVSPAAMFVVPPTGYSTSPGAGGLTHYVLDLANPVTLAANDAANPRWFIGIVGLTAQAYYTWNWAQDLSGSTHTFQFIRGGTAGGGDLFVILPEGRALMLGDSTLPGDLNCDGLVNFADINPFVVYLSNFPAWQTTYPGCPAQNGDINQDGTYPSFGDINPFVTLLSAK